MTSVYPQQSGNSMSYNHSNFQAISQYGLSYYDSSISDYSDGYQSSVSPDLNYCQASYKNYHPLQHNQQQNYYQNDHKGSLLGIYQQQSQHQHPAKPLSSFKDDLQNLKITTDCMRETSSTLGLAKKIVINEKPLVVAPEVLKKRRSAANARERRRMNNLNFAFDRYV
jgi:hypothetical protein